MQTPWDDARRQREAAARIGDALAAARSELDAVDNTPSNELTDLHYAAGYWALEDVLRQLVEACEVIDWSRSGARDPDTSVAPLDGDARVALLKEIAEKYSDLYGEGYLEWVRDPKREATD